MGKTKNKNTPSSSQMATSPRDKPPNVPLARDSSFSVLEDGGEEDERGAEYESPKGGDGVDEADNDVDLDGEEASKIRDASATLQQVREKATRGNNEEPQSAEAAVGHFLGEKLARCAAARIRIAKPRAGMDKPCGYPECTRWHTHEHGESRFEKSLLDKGFKRCH